MPIDPRLDQIIDGLYRISAKAIIIHDGKLLVIQEHGAGWWSIPGGGIDHGEQPANALKREIFEEIGVPPEKVTSTWQIAFMSIGSVVEGVPRANTYYVVDIPAEVVTLTDSIMAFKWVTKEELAKLYLSPSIENGLARLSERLV